VEVGIGEIEIEVEAMNEMMVGKEEEKMDMMMVMEERMIIMMIDPGKKGEIKRRRKRRKLVLNMLNISAPVSRFHLFVYFNLLILII
jgi:hypothetical protein